MDTRASRLATVKQFAERLGITRDSVYKRIKNGSLPKGSNLIEIAGKKFISYIPIEVKKVKKEKV